MINPLGTPSRFFDHQIEAVGKLESGSILCGGVGSGKSLTAIMYYHGVVCKSGIVTYFRDIQPLKVVKKLVIVTTAKKRDSLEWEKDLAVFGLVKPDVIIESWNNIGKYTNQTNSFFIFDEQRLVGSGSWVKSFLKIVKQNEWILLTATPGDTWMDYIPVFLANGFYRNRTEFIRTHVVYNNFTKFPKVDRYIEVTRLERQRQKLMVLMNYEKHTTPLVKRVAPAFDGEKLRTVFIERWNPFKNEPIKDITGLLYIARKVVNSDPARLVIIKELLEKHKKIIVFYNFDYEVEILRSITGYPFAEYNGHKHQPIPNTDSWLYAVQYSAGSEGWNCIETNVVVFYSQTYSYKSMVQAMGRVDRLNTPFEFLYYYHLVSDSPIDKAIERSLSLKKDFNQNEFAEKTHIIIEGRR